ncbi:hypothetical protein DPMN_133082 [Dreissena polymorpha]|uniref:Uncharacterized protein n=1 Tax=Dreissena polymorpha TaxID=45954 RepID=A0A9D4FX77_DREPO|nr:hypothetical protein DPMN_133082 [Dreissena polymorpha]
METIRHGNNIQEDTINVKELVEIKVCDLALRPHSHRNTECCNGCKSSSSFSRPE